MITQKPLVNNNYSGLPGLSITNNGKLNKLIKIRAYLNAVKI